MGIGEKVVHEPGTIVRHFAEVCLQRWGVTLDKKLNLDGVQLLELHQAIQRNAPLFANAKNVYTISRTMGGALCLSGQHRKTVLVLQGSRSSGIRAGIGLLN
jgi:hypothetical protein